MSVSRRADAVPPFIVMDVMREAAEKEARNESVIHLEVGQPSTPAPSGAGAAREALSRDRLGCRRARHPELRERIARHYRERHGIDVPADRVIVTTGSSNGFPAGVPWCLRRRRARGGGAGLSALPQHPSALA